ncbi:MAG: CocE/NonD family hydrolase [Planctomycetota bacterium]
MRRFCLILALVAYFPALGEEENPWVRELDGIHIPMRDGKWLAADVHFPPKAGKYPAILIQTPYNRKYFGAEVGERVAGRRVRRRVRGLYDREYYVYVIVDWRGFYGSKEAAKGLVRVQRGPDGYDCVEWIAEQPWSDGKVGTWGGSALAKAQFDTAALKPPHLVCAVPLIASMGQRYGFYYSAGVYRKAHVRTLKILGYKIGNKVWDAPRPNQIIWRYAERLTYKPQLLDLPMLFVTGWWDHFPDSILTMFADVRVRSGPRARAHSKLIVGPWTHMDVDLPRQGGLTFPDAVDVEKKASMAFFDYWLRGIRDNGWDETPVTRYYRVADGEGGTSGRWIECEAWPGIEVETVKLNLHASGRIDAEALPEANGELPFTREYRYDPRKPSPTIGGCNLPPLGQGPMDQSLLEERSDVLAYATGPLESPLRVAGNMTVAVAFSVNRVDADFTVRVCDVHPDGKAFHVVDGIQRAKYRAGSVERLLEPGTRYGLKIRLPVTAYTFAKGHALKVLLSSSNYPRFEPNPHTGDPHFDEAKALDLQVTIFHDRENPTFIELPVVK